MQLGVALEGEALRPFESVADAAPDGLVVAIAREPHGTRDRCEARPLARGARLDVVPLPDDAGAEALAALTLLRVEREPSRIELRHALAALGACAARREESRLSVLRAHELDAPLSERERLLEERAIEPCELALVKDEIDRVLERLLEPRRAVA